MPKPNKGARLERIAGRKNFYIVWFEMGLRQVRSTGTERREAAEQVFNSFIQERPDLAFGARPVRIAYDEDGPVREQIPQHVYFIRSSAGPIKIGRARNVERRLATLRTHSPVTLELAATQPGDHSTEYLYHALFAEHRLHGEWFAPCQEIEDQIARLTQ